MQLYDCENCRMLIGRNGIRLVSDLENNCYSYGYKVSLSYRFSKHPCCLFVICHGGRGDFPKYLVNISPRKKLRGKSNEHLLQSLPLARS